MGSVSVVLRREQECSVDGCHKPAHIGDLCAACFYAATPARRQVELDCQDLKEGARCARDAWNEQMRALMAAPAYGEVA